MSAASHRDFVRHKMSGSSKGPRSAHEPGPASSFKKQRSCLTIALGTAKKPSPNPRLQEIGVYLKPRNLKSSSLVGFGTSEAAIA